MTNSETMEKTGWHWEGMTPKGKDFQIIDEIPPWAILAETESDQHADYCDIWSNADWITC